MKPSFRATILATILLLMVASLAAVAAFVLHRNAQSARAVAGLRIEQALKDIEAQVDRFLGKGPLALHRLDRLVRGGLIDPADRDRLEAYMARELRAEPDLTWLSHSDARTGAFLGVTRRDGVLVVNRASPDADGGRPQEWELMDGGVRLPLAPKLRVPYDPRTTSWFRLGGDAPAPRWTDLYRFAEGEWGISSVMRIAAPDGSVGVVTADFHLEVLEAFLAALRVGGGGRAAILVPQLGEAHAVLGGSSLPAAMAAALNQALLGTAKPAGRIVHEDASGAAIALDMRAFDLGNGRPWLLAVMMSAEEIEGPIRRATRDTLLVAAAFLLFGVAAAAWISAVITRPIRAMSEDLARVGELELTGAPPRTFIRELDRMGRSLSAMKAALRSFARYVPVEIVRGPLLSGREAEPGGELRDVTVLFTDIEGFTRIAEALGPERSMQELAGYFEVLEEAVAAQGGVIDKYMGDGAMVLFNAPTPLADHAARACAAALRFQAGLDALNRTRAAQGLPPFRTRMGLATGPAVVGNFGTARRMAYTAIGDVVNVASRLEPLNDVYGTGILADAGVRAAAGEGFAWRRLDRIALVGRAEPVELYELVPAGTGAAEAPRTLGRAA